MNRAQLALRMPDAVGARFEPILPPVVYAGTGRKPCRNHACLQGRRYVRITGIGWDYVPPCFPCADTIQQRLRLWLQRDCFHRAWQQLAQRYRELHGTNWDKVLVDGSKKPAQKGGADTGPSPVDRSKSGSAIHLATDEHGLPVGATITKAGANGGVQPQQVLAALVVKPPPPATPVAHPDPRALPRARAGGAYGNRPTQARANAAGFRREAPRRGRARQPGAGSSRRALERGHALLAPFGRIARRLDRSRRRFLGGVQLAAALSCVRAQAHGFFRQRTVMNACFSP